MANVKFGYPKRDMSQDGLTHTIVYYGTLQEMQELQLTFPINMAGENGRVASNSLHPVDGYWELEIRSSANWDGNTVEGPDTAYGKKSAQIHGSMLSMQLEAHKNYRTCWNYFLMCAPGVAAVPSWWETAKDPILEESQAQKYQWCRSTAETPVVAGVKWRVLRVPEMPGVQTFDLATWTLTETARYRSFKSALEDMGDRLNAIISPYTKITVKSGRTWKCDDAGIQWSGKYWLGTYTYTLSGPGGWNKKLYED